MSDVTPPPPPAPGQPPLWSDERRRAALSMAVMGSVHNGWRVESQTDFQAVMVTGQPVNHVLHLLLTILTCGLWALVWLILAGNGGEQRKVVWIDPYGHTLWQ